MCDRLQRALARAAWAVCGAWLIAATPLSAQRRAMPDAATAATWASLLAVQDARSADTVVIDAALASRFAPLRAAAVRVVGGNRVAARYPALRALLRGERDSTVARDAAFALGLAADTASCVPLTAALGATDVGGAAAWALGELADRCGAFAPLLDIAASPAVRAALLRVAVKWTTFPDSAVVAAYRVARAPAERWAAMYALARARRAAGGPLALTASRDTSARLREVAARLLALPLQEAPADAARVRLSALLRDAEPHVRIAAVRSIASYGVVSTPAIDSVVRVEQDANVRATMTQAIDSLAALSSAARDSQGTTRAVAATRPPASDARPAAARTPAPAEYARIVREFVVPTLAGRAPELVLGTQYGPIRIRLDGVQAPMTSDNLTALARRGYFTGLRFHRVVPAFVAQGGDPGGDGSGGPGYAIRDELNRTPYLRGAVGMALSGPDTGGSQFFLTLAPQPHLDGHYTVFGQVVAGQAAMDALVKGDTLRTMTPMPR